ncbi:MAG: hypothetical protein LBS99_02515 [Clostridiales bacterium]|nr:hypothetical protein [Clostridiales bacterium]
MGIIRAAVGALKECEPGSFARNLDAVRGEITSAALSGAGILVLPARALCGDAARGFLTMRAFTDGCEHALQKTAAFLKGKAITVLLGSALRIEDTVTDITAVLARGKLLAVITPKPLADEITVGGFAVPCGPNIILKNITDADITVAVTDGRDFASALPALTGSGVNVLAVLCGRAKIDACVSTAELMRVSSHMYKCAIMHTDGIIAENGELLANSPGKTAIAEIDAHRLNFARAVAAASVKNDAHRAYVDIAVPPCKTLSAPPERLPLIPANILGLAEAEAHITQALCGLIKPDAPLVITAPDLVGLTAGLLTARRAKTRSGCSKKLYAVQCAEFGTPAITDALARATDTEFITADDYAGDGAQILDCTDYTRYGMNGALGIGVPVLRAFPHTFLRGLIKYYSVQGFAAPPPGVIAEIVGSNIYADLELADFFIHAVLLRGDTAEKALFRAAAAFPELAQTAVKKLFREFTTAFFGSGAAVFPEPPFDTAKAYARADAGFMLPGL